ncbi:Hsp20/alpha crystallin family protein [Cohnella candidum]|uniref:Hsp20/alpha crystallin family protein n=1 Tax=Cohnella candidum TaxID=2674991 RepID=A0A3G3JXC1_9BACL|nr:Hsp20/alpha crystallin family protein [Cohnella candidum]AYQ72865.1 Hsp20/alpha crystallin family protein [Cohnella candidum]
MNPDKLNKWLELARSFAGNDFWSDVFDQSPAPESFARKSHAGKTGESAALFPPVDVLTSDREILILVDLPGVSKEDIHLTVSDEVLYLKGQSNPLYPEHTPVSTERFSGTFERPIGLPTRIDGQNANIHAAFRHGTLIIRIPVPPAWTKSIPID